MDFGFSGSVTTMVVVLGLNTPRVVIRVTSSPLIFPTCRTLVQPVANTARARRIAGHLMSVFIVFVGYDGAHAPSNYWDRFSFQASLSSASTIIWTSL